MSAEPPGPIATAGADLPEVMQRIAQLTRMLRSSMRELGLDQAIQDAAHAIPDARDRLLYVAHMTEQAAERVLNAAEQIQPRQESLQREAEELAARWQAWAAQPVPLDPGHALVAATRGLLAAVPETTKPTQRDVMEIILAQDFQDLTGQVITKMLKVVSTIETELVQVLIDNAPAARREEVGSMLNGPAIGSAPPGEVMASQDEVDDLLADLGF